MASRRSAEKSRRRQEQVPIPKPASDSSPWVNLSLALAVFVLAFCLRLIYLFEIESIPLFYHLAADARVYNEWAQRIAAGDWLGQEVFYQAPLYPYFLGLLQSILGRDLWSIRVVQILLGAASCCLLYGVGRLFFSPAAGLAAALLLALYGPVIFYDGLIQKAAVDLFLIAFLLFLLGQVETKPQGRPWLAIGVILGLLGLSRENALIWVFVVPAWVWLHFSACPTRVRFAWLGLFLLGLTLVLLPVGLRNLKVGGEFAWTTSQLGPNFFIGNNPQADGTYIPLRGGHGDPQFERQDATEIAEQALGRPLSPGEVSSFWLRRSLDYVLAQPMDWIRLMVRKGLIVLNVREIEDADDFYLYQRWSWLLRVLGQLNLGVLGPLAAMGIVLTWRQRRRLWLLYALSATFTFSVALFYVFGRYRLPLVPFLALFAGAGIAEGLDLWRERRLHRVLTCAAAGLVAVALVHWPIVGKPGPSAVGYNNLGNAFAKQGRVDESIESYQQALRLDPSDAVAYYNLGNLFVSRGRVDEALHYYQEAVTIQPDFAEAHNNLGDVLVRRDELEAAIPHFRLALRLGPNRPEFRFNLATALARQGYLDEARGHLEQALRVRPGFAEAHHRLGLVLAAQGHLDWAIDHFRRALQIQPEFAEAHEGLGAALAQKGKRDEAVQHYQEALRIMRSRREAYAPR